MPGSNFCSAHAAADRPPSTSKATPAAASNDPMFRVDTCRMPCTATDAQPIIVRNTFIEAGEGRSRGRALRRNLTDGDQPRMADVPSDAFADLCIEQQEHMEQDVGIPLAELQHRTNKSRASPSVDAGTPKQNRTQARCHRWRSTNKNPHASNTQSPPAQPSNLQCSHPRRLVRNQPS